MNAAPESVSVLGFGLAMMKGSGDSWVPFFVFEPTVCFPQPEGRILLSILLQLEIIEMQKGFCFLKRGMKIDIMRVH